MPPHLAFLWGMMAVQVFIHLFIYLFIENHALSVSCEPGTGLGFGNSREQVGQKERSPHVYDADTEREHRHNK